MELAVDEGDRGAIVLADMTPDRAVAVDVEPAMALRSLRQAAFRLQHDILGVHDQEKLAAAGHVGPDVSECILGDGDRRAFGQEAEDLEGGDLGLGCKRFHDPIGLFSKCCKRPFAAIIRGLCECDHAALTQHRLCGRHCGPRGR